MKYEAMCVAILMSFISMSHIDAREHDFPVLKGPYLSQIPPGELPEAFAPSIIFSDSAVHGCIAFYPDGNEIYWIFHPSTPGQNPPAICFIRQIDGQWTEPEILEFSKEYGAMSLCISPDGTTLFFNSRRPWPDSWGKQPGWNTLEAYKIWYVERVGSGWGAPKPLDKGINQNLGGVSCTNDGTLYTQGIKRIRAKDHQYMQPEQLGHPLDLGRIPGGNPYISPDESYILFNKKWPGKFGYGIFVSYRTRDDRWTEPVNLLEKVNAARGGSQPTVTPDGKYLFFYSGGRFCWMDAKVINDCAPEGLR